MMCAYGPTLGHGARREFWQEMDKEIEKIKTIPCCILGDLNALEKDDEATGLVHAKELVQPLLKMWSERKILFDLWKWHGKKEGPEALTRALLKTSDISTLDWALSHHKALLWEFGSRGKAWSGMRRRAAGVSLCFPFLFSGHFLLLLNCSFTLLIPMDLSFFVCPASSSSLSTSGLLL